MTEATVDKIKLSGYLPGAIGRIVELHATYYNQHWGFDLCFESQVATELSEFLLQFDETRDGFWVAVLDDKIVGSVAIDGNSSTEGARLRWFILAPEYQGRGIGKALLARAIEFCHRAKFNRVYLWTFPGLASARYLYNKFGFILCEEHEDNAWGSSVTHQMFKLNL